MKLTTASAHIFSVDRSGTATIHYAVSTADDVPTNVVPIATNFTVRDEHDHDDDDADADDDAKTFDCTNGPCGPYGEFKDSCVISLSKSQKRSSTLELAGNLTSEPAHSVHGVGRPAHEPQSSIGTDGTTMNHDYCGQSSQCPTEFNRTQLLQFAYFRSATSQISSTACAQSLQVSCAVRYLTIFTLLKIRIGGKYILCC